MAQLAAVTLGDSAAVVHTFSPVKIDAMGIAAWADRSGGIPLGFPLVTMSVRDPSKNGAQNEKVTIKVVVPVLEVTSASTASGIQPAPTLSYNLIANIELVLPTRSTLTQRKDLLAYVKNFMANATFVTPAVETFESIF